MNRLLATNATKLIARLNRRELEFGFKPNSLRPLPRFYGTRGDISCRDEELFALHTIINAIRGTRRSVNFAISAIQARNIELFAPSIALAYTSAFHAIGAHQSLEGRTSFDRVIWSSVDDKIIESPVDVVAGILTKDNYWKFEPRKRSHSARWQELTQLGGRSDYEIPTCFDRLFEYMYAGAFRKGASMPDLLADPNVHRVKMNEVFPDFLVKISQVRHLALYAASGEDPQAVEGLWNNDPSAGAYVGKQAEALVSFACGLLRHVADEVWTLFADMGLCEEASQDLGLCVRIPWYDQLKLDLLGESDLKDALLNVESIVEGKRRGSV